LSRLALAWVAVSLALPAAARAQNAESEADRKVQDAISAQTAQIDLTPEECRPGNRIPGQITVCADGRRNERERLPLPEEREGAHSTGGGVPPTPDVYGLKRLPGGVTVKGCFIPPCPPPPMYFFDIRSLPEAPAGSDADRIAKGEIKAP